VDAEESTLTHQHSEIAALVKSCISHDAPQLAHIPRPMAYLDCCIKLHETSWDTCRPEHIQQLLFLLQQDCIVMVYTQKHQQGTAGPPVAAHAVSRSITMQLRAVSCRLRQFEACCKGLEAIQHSADITMACTISAACAPAGDRQ
jgi:hypothetical protein